MKNVSDKTFQILSRIFKDRKPNEIKESCRLYHFYFGDKNGMSCSYTKDDALKLISEKQYD
jgi:hypothetical protein